VIQVFVSSLAAAQTDLDLRHGDCVLALSTQPWCRRQFVLGDTLRRDLVTNPVFIGLRSNSPHAHSHHMVPGRAEENYSSPFPLPRLWLFRTYTKAKVGGADEFAALKSI
jgi:hypothetical protein